MSLIAWYKLDGDALDSSGNGRDGSLINTPNVVVGKIGNAYSFDLATADGISIPDNKFPLYDFTMTAWIKPVGNHYHYDGTIISSGNWNSSHWSFGVNQSNTGFSCRSPYASGAYTFTLNTWHFVVYRREGTNLKLYSNNTLVYNGTVTTHIPLSSDATNTCIGRETYAGGYFGFNGSIDDVRIYDHALSEKEVKELSKAKILHYDFDGFQEPTENLVDFSTLAYNNYNYRTATTTSGDFIRVTCVDLSTGGDTAWQVSYKSKPLTANETYTFSFKVRGFNFYNLDLREGGSWRTNIQWYDTNNNSLGYSLADYRTINDTETIFSIKGKAPLNTSYAILSVGADTPNFNKIGDYVEIKDFQIEKKDHATPFTPSTRAGSVSDKSGYDNHAELELATTPQWTEDSKIGSGAYKFDGTTSGIERIGNFSDIKTISMWVNRQSIPTDSRVLLVHQPTGVGLGFYNNGYLILSSSGNSQRTAIISGFKNNSWNHIAITYSDTKVPTCYINGVETTYSTTNNWTIPETTLYIGRRTSGSAFDGQIDDVRIYATALSADDIKELYQTRASIDNKGNLFCGGINEYSNWDKPIINETGVFNTQEFNEVGLPIRYIRDSMVGSSANTGNHWVEIQAFNSRDNNIALGKTAVSSILTDGNTNSSPYYSTGPATVDLGDIYTIMYLKIWHYWADARTYHKIKTEVSADNINWITVFDSDKDGEYVETSEGKEIILYPNKASIRETGEVFVREINEV